MRLFIDTRISSLINNYDKGLGNTALVDEREIKYQADYVESFATNHFTPLEMKRVADSTYLNPTNIIPSEDKLINITAEQLVQFSSQLMQYKNYATWLKAYYTRDKKNAADFIKDIREELDITD